MQRRNKLMHKHGEEGKKEESTTKIQSYFFPSPLLAMAPKY